MALRASDQRPLRAMTQNGCAGFDSPLYAGAFESLTEHDFAGSLGDTTADRNPKSAMLSIVHPSRVPTKIVVRGIIIRFLPHQTANRSQLSGAPQDSKNPALLFFQHATHFRRPSIRCATGAEDRLSHSSHRRSPSSIPLEPQTKSRSAVIPDQIDMAVSSQNDLTIDTDRCCDGVLLGDGVLR